MFTFSSYILRKMSTHSNCASFLKEGHNIVFYLLHALIFAFHFCALLFASLQVYSQIGGGDRIANIPLVI